MKRNSVLIFILSLTVAFNTGCAALVIGGAAAASGYYVGQDKRKVSEIAEDASITAGIKTALIRDKRIKALDINVETFKGKVTLYGRVTDKALIKRCIDIAKTIKGVKTVDSKLAVISE